MSKGKKLAAAFIFAFCAALAAYSCAFAAATPAAPEEKVGAIEPQKVLFQHPKYEQILQQIKSIADQKQNEAKTAIDKESDNGKKAEIFQNMRRTIAEEEQKLMQPLFREIDLAVRTIATAKKITVVVDKTALFYGAVDITDDVVQELKKKNASGG
ncbi:MAG: OmpH family outer membrane protein [Synergistaceae bacterium]|jgi:outer membrane protein|nr:OmpH family outer membrane protein [Synergistaceae bacterium]